MAKKIIYNIT